MNSNIPNDADKNDPLSTSGDSLKTPVGPKQSPASQGGVARRNYLWLSALIIVCAAGVDQLTKLWAVRELTGQAPLPLLGEFLRFTLVYNEGGAMGTNFGGALYYLIIGIAILLVIVYYLWLYRFSVRYSAPLALIASGAVGNLIDRVRLGRVVDWIDVDFFDIDLFGFQLERWWTFNIADASITLALMYMIWAVFTSPVGKMEKRASDTASDSGQPRSDSEDFDSTSRPISRVSDVSATDPPLNQNP